VSVWFIFLGMLGPMVVLMVGMIIAQHLGLFRSTGRIESESGPKSARLPLGRRHPLSVMLSLVFGAGFLAGGIFGGIGFLSGGLLGGIGGTVLFILLSFILALIATGAQSIRHVWGRASRARSANAGNAAEKIGAIPFHRRFADNFEATAGFLIQGWSPYWVISAHCG
jgi:hypothetical protein